MCTASKSECKSECKIDDFYSISGCISMFNAGILLCDIFIMIGM